MTPLPHPENLHLQAAEGWLLLGDPASAEQELARLSATARTRPEVLDREWTIHAQRERWAEAHAVAQRLVAAAPADPNGWLRRAYAARRMPGGGLQSAWDALRPAVGRFAQEPLIAYNLACYAAQMTRLAEAWGWLQRALAMAPRRAKLQDLALADADLQPLWPILTAQRAPGRR